MMKRISITAVCLISFLPAISFANDLLFKSINYKKVYCNNEEFVGNSGAKRPHLHCGSTFLTYKKANGDHVNLTEVGNCNRTNNVFEDVKANKIAFANYPSIYNALVSYHKTGCPNKWH